MVKTFYIKYKIKKKESEISRRAEEDFTILRLDSAGLNLGQSRASVLSHTHTHTRCNITYTFFGHAFTFGLINMKKDKYVVDIWQFPVFL